jgi:hypothetical protein
MFDAISFCVRNGSQDARRRGNLQQQAHVQYNSGMRGNSLPEPKGTLTSGVKNPDCCQMFEHQQRTTFGSELSIQLSPSLLKYPYEATPFKKTSLAQLKTSLQTSNADTH